MADTNKGPWIQDEIIGMWPRVKAELLEFAKRLEENDPLLAREVRMVLDAAEMTINRFKSPYHDLAEKVCPELKSDFMNFVNGMDDDESAVKFLAHLEHCDRCSDAIEEAYHQQAVEFENLARHLMADDPK